MMSFLVCTSIHKVKILLLINVLASCTSAEDDSLHDIKYLLVTGGTHLPWFSLGLALGLYYGTLKAIQSDRDNQSGCLTDTLTAWLRQEDAVQEQGLPSWKALARALTHPLVSQRSLVDEITKRYQKVEWYSNTLRSVMLFHSLQIEPSYN